MDTWLTPSDLASLAGIGYRNAVMALQKALAGKNWRGVRLNVREIERQNNQRGYLVERSSLPQALRNRAVVTPEYVDEENSAPAAEEVDAEVNFFAGYDSESLWASWDFAGVKKQEIAEQRLHLLLEVERRAQNEKKEDVLRELSIPRRTYFNWRAQIDGIARADWLPALLPAHVGNPVGKGFDPRIMDTFKDFYLTKLRRSYEHCYQLTADVANNSGYGDMPSLKTLQRRLHAQVDDQVIAYARYGEDAKSFKKPTPTVIRDRRMMRSLEELNGDGYDHKFYVVFPDGEEARPTTWFWQDTYSGALVCWYADKSENSDMLRLSLRKMYVTHGMGTNGSPFVIRVDNTHAASAKILTGRMPQRHRFKMRDDEPLGIFAKLGHDYRPVLPYSGQSKPIERKFGIGGISALVDCAPETEGARDKGHGISWDVFQMILEREVTRLNNRVSKSLVCGGVKSPQQVFEDSLSRCTLLKATEQQLNLLLLCAIGVTCRAPTGEVRLFGENTYWHEAMQKYVGKKVAVEYDPQNLHGDVNILTLDGKFICTAQCQMALGYADTDAARETLKLKRRAQKRTKQALRDAVQMGALERAGRLPVTENVAPSSEDIALAVQNIAFMDRQQQTEVQVEQQSEYNAEVIEFLQKKSRKSA